MPLEKLGIEYVPQVNAATLKHDHAPQLVPLVPPPVSTFRFEIDSFYGRHLVGKTPGEKSRSRDVYATTKENIVLLY